MPAMLAAASPITKNSLEPVAMPRRMANKSASFALSPAGLPDDPASARPVHFPAASSSSAGHVRLCLGLCSVPPKVKSTAWSRRGGEFTKHTTADDTSASPNCTSEGSKRWMRRSVTLRSRYSFSGRP